MVSKESDVIAIDGPSGSGKSTVAARVAAELGYVYFNSGYMYRALALAAISDGKEDAACDVLGELAACLEMEFSDDGKSIKLGGKDVTNSLRDPEISRVSSRISACAEVRKKMVARQRALAAKHGKIVMEGRDIGTFVFPQAAYKIYLDADLATRVARRGLELQAKGIEKKHEELEEEMAKRDRGDKERALAPLKRADDALYIDSGGKSIEEVVEEIGRYIHREKD